MRDIEFRGKDFSGFWHHGFLCVADENCMMILEKFDSGVSSALVYPETVGQYTGLKDRNGKRIFESDIVTIGDGSEPLYVAFVDFAWQLMNDKYELYKHRLGLEKEEVYTVIGNIHDNLEMLEGVIL